jgi:hypothetical protein
MVSVVDTPQTTSDAYPGAVTISGAATGLIIAIAHSVGTGDATAPDTVTMGGQSLALVGVSEGAGGAGHDVSLSFWALNASKIAAASDNIISVSGGLSTGQAGVYFTISGSGDVETLSAVVGDPVNANTGAVSAVRAANSLTFGCSLHDNSSFGFSGLADPSLDEEITATNIDLAYGIEADTDRTADFTWTNSITRNNSTLVLNIPEGGPSLVVTQSELTPGGTISGTYSNYETIPTTLTVSDGTNTITISSPTITDNGDGTGTFSGTMPSLPSSGTASLILFGDVTVELT